MIAHWSFIFLLHFLPFDNRVSADSIIKITAPEVVVRAGKKGIIKVYVAVKNGYHIQSNKVNDELIIPTTLEIDTQGIIKAGKQSFPAEKKFRLEGTADYLPVYDGNFKISVAFTAGEKIQKGKYSLTAKFRYQACDSRTCFSPKIIDFIIFVTIL